MSDVKLISTKVVFDFEVGFEVGNVSYAHAQDSHHYIYCVTRHLNV